MKLVQVIIVAIIMSDNGSSQMQSLENWMGDLSPKLKNVPLIYLAIPGSHDSMTYSITRSSTVAPDSEPIVKQLYPLFRGTIIRWTITQSLDVYQQLLLGIRYFDLRIATKTSTDGLFFVHGLYGAEITRPLEIIKEFLDSHPEEVVILDFQHFYAFTDEDHHRLIRFILDMFRDKLYPRSVNLEAMTLNSMSRLRKQVIGVYRNKQVFATTELWQSQMLPSPWPQKDTVSGLLNFIDNIQRPPGIGFVHQAVLTPTPSFIVLRWISNLRSKCAIPVREAVLPRIQDLSPGPPQRQKPATVNVVIADFVDLDNGVFPRTIINLNQKLLSNDRGPTDYS